MIKHILFLIVFVLALAALTSYWGYLAGGVPSAWLYIDRFGLFLGIVAFVPVLYAVWKYIKFMRLEEEERKRIHTEVGTRPVVFIVAVGNVSIRNEVESFLKEQDGFKDFDFESRVFVSRHDTKMIQSSDINAIMDDIELKLSEIHAKAANKIHLFIKAPLPIALMVGEVLSNQIPTLVYHKQQNQGYENWGALHR